MSKRFELINFLNAHDNFKDNKNNKRLDSFDVVELLNHYDKLQTLLVEKDQQIAELEEQLKNAIVPKFKVGQEIWEITPLMSWKIKRIEWHKFNGGAGDVVVEIYRLGHDGTDDYNCCIMPVDSDRFFATKEEAEAKLKELTAKNV